MMRSNELFNENTCNIRKLPGMSIVLAEKKIILPEVEKNDGIFVCNHNGIMIADSLEQINSVLSMGKKGRLYKMR